MPDDGLSLDLGALRRSYASGTLRPGDVVAEVSARIAARGDDHVWIHRTSDEEIAAYVRALDGKDAATLPLYGVPFAIKDNIDLAGAATTIACPAAAYTAEGSATAVARAIAAGAIPIGKTNLDQFATGLVGVRSPYGVPVNPFDPAFVPGGSSSGSAVAVAAGLVSFALGTDTAGSGRVPAAFTNVVGLKPTRGRVSAKGVVPACRTLDCVSIFALTCADAADVLAAIEGFDVADPFSRAVPRSEPAGVGARFRFGVPRPADLAVLDAASAELFEAATARLAGLGGAPVTVDLGPFFAAGRLLYDGPWLAERHAAIHERLASAGEAALLPVIRAVVAPGAHPSAAAAFAGFYRLRELRRMTEPVWNDVDVLLAPTAPTIPRIAEVRADPIAQNARLGLFTTFVNLLDLTAVAVPAGLRPDGLPFGVSLLAPGFHEARLLELGHRLHAAAAVAMGATRHPVPDPRPRRRRMPGGVEVVVCGAHMTGLPLNARLVDRGGRLVEATATAPVYRMVDLGDGRPGLERVAAGAAIEVEVWELPIEGFGALVAEIPPPLGIGSVRLASGRDVKGFLCEAVAAREATDITSYGGWRRYLVSRK